VAAPGLTPGSPMHLALEGRGMTAHDIPLRRTGMDPAADLHSMFSLWRLMRRIRPHYMLGYTIKPVIDGTLAAWLARVPRRIALITGLGYAFQGEGRSSRRLLRSLAQGLYRQGLKKAHVIFFQNADDKELFHSLNILSPKQDSHVV